MVIWLTKKTAFVDYRASNTRRRQIKYISTLAWPKKLFTHMQFNSMTIANILTTIINHQIK